MLGGLNLSKYKASVRSARAIVLINWQPVKFTDITVEQNGFSAADTFEIVLPFFVRDQQNGETILANGPEFQSIFLTQDSIPVQVYIGYPSNPNNYSISDLVQLIDGTIDTVKWDFDITGEFVTIDGRNKVGKMIDNKIVDKLPNQTSSQIANYFAGYYGLVPVVTPTTTLAGTYYNNGSAITPDTETTEWDLLQFLAQQENFIVRVKDNQLLFGPYSDVTGYEDTTPVTYTWGKDIEKLEIERSPHAARDIVVKVISYDRKTKTRIYETSKGVTKTYTSSSDVRIVETASSSTQRALGSSGQIGRREQYVETYTIPGLTRDQAQKKAKAIYNQLSNSQLIGTIDASGNTDLSVDKQINLQGVGLGLVNNYYLNKVEHRYNLNDGYTIEASFSNQFMSNENSVEEAS